MRTITDLKNAFPEIEKFDRVVRIYEMWANVPQGTYRLKIKILQSDPDDERFEHGLPKTSAFTGVANLAVKGKGSDAFYRSIYPHDTEIEALYDAIKGFFAFISIDAEIKEVEDW